MRASDLLGLQVVGPDDAPLGHVVDVRLVQDGPLLGAFAALRVQGFVVGRHGLAARLGYDRQESGGPWLLRKSVRWWTRDNRFLPWEAATVHADRVSAQPSALTAVPTI
jgi:hypothetical protein